MYHHVFLPEQQLDPIVRAGEHLGEPDKPLRKHQCIWCCVGIAVASFASHTIWSFLDRGGGGVKDDWSCHGHCGGDRHSK